MRVDFASNRLNNSERFFSNSESAPFKTIFTPLIFSIYFAAMLQGVTIVLFPAASIIFNDPQLFNLSSAAYGGLFIPEVITAIFASLWSASKSDTKTVYLYGIVANIFSMIFLLLSVSAMSYSTATYGLLLFSLGFAGIGYGLTAPSLNILATSFFPKNTNTAILSINALIGLGTALAPLSVIFFITMGIWWGIPLLLLVLFIMIFLFTLKTMNPENNVAIKLKKIESFPKGIWLFCLFALLYGIVETVDGNWTAAYIRENIIDSIALESITLASFWAMMTAGRVIFGLLNKTFSEYAYQIFPFAAAVAFSILSLLPPGHEFLGIILFAICGMACSILFPLSISFATDSLPEIKTSIPGILLGFYLLGYSITAFGVGLLHDNTSIGLRTIFSLAACMAVVMGFITKKLLKK
ncbi:MAG: MFS transporter [Parachlamydiaceae bacterium]